MNKKHGKKKRHRQNIEYIFGAGGLTITQEHGIKESREEDASKYIRRHSICVILVFVCEVRRDS
jgi:hypothetical protein